MTRLYKRGLTLVELLITMAIMAIIAAAIMGTASAAMESARRSRTQSIVSKIDRLVAEWQSSYETRRVNVHPAYEAAITNTSQIPREQQGVARADVTLLAARELQKYEMPDRWSDVLTSPQFLAALPDAAYRYRRAYQAMTVPVDQRVRFQSAECLYLFVIGLTGEGEARTQFPAQDIGDVDGDGAKEFLDGWRQPISWVRWPAFYGRTALPILTVSDTLPPEWQHEPADRYRRDLPGAIGPPGNRYVVPRDKFYGEQQINVTRTMTIFVPFLRDQYPAFRLSPLIFSPGRDGVSDINTGADENNPMNPTRQDASNPYNPSFDLGAQKDLNDDGEAGWLDNVNNYITNY